MIFQVLRARNVYLTEEGTPKIAGFDHRVLLDEELMDSSIETKEVGVFRCRLSPIMHKQVGMYNFSENPKFYTMFLTCLDALSPKWKSNTFHKTRKIRKF